LTTLKTALVALKPQAGERTNTAAVAAGAFIQGVNRETRHIGNFEILLR
jgi:hypothetical protein